MRTATLAEPTPTQQIWTHSELMAQQWNCGVRMRPHLPVQENLTEALAAVQGAIALGQRRGGEATVSLNLLRHMLRWQLFGWLERQPLGSDRRTVQCQNQREADDYLVSVLNEASDCFQIVPLRRSR